MVRRWRVLMLVAGLAVLAGRLPSAEAADQEAKVSGFNLVRKLKGDVVQTFKFSPDGKYLVSLACNDDYTIRLFDVATGKLIRKTSLEGLNLFRLVFLPGGRTLAVIGWKPKNNSWPIHLLDVPSLTEKAKLDPSGEENSWLISSPNGKWWAIGTNRSALLWDVNAGKRLWYIPFPQVQPAVLNPQPQPAKYLCPMGVTFSPDGRMVAMTFMDGTLRLYDPANGKELSRLIDRETQTRLTGRYGLTFSPDGKLLAVGMGQENMIRLWDVATREPRTAIRWSWQFGQKSVPMGTDSVVFSPDGKTVAAACQDETIRMWEVATGKLRHEAEAEMVDFIAFSFDGRCLASSHSQSIKYIYLWDWHNLGLPSSHRLTEEEAERFWRDLSAPDAAAAYRAVAALAESPQQALGLLKRLRPVEPITSADIDKLIKELNDDGFATRERASHKLAELGAMVEMQLRKALAQNKSPEVRRRARDLLLRLGREVPSEQLRFLRAVELLEYLGTPEAREILQKLSRGGAGRIETEDAKAALRRLMCGRLKQSGTGLGRSE